MKNVINVESDLNKVINRKFDKNELESKIQKLENKRYKSKQDYILLEKYKSELKEHTILKFFDRLPIVKQMIYQNDFTAEKSERQLETDEYIQNKNNTYGCDLIVTTTNDKTFYVDLKVLSYKPKYYHEVSYPTGKVYHGELNERYGVDNLTFQLYQQAKDKDSYVSDEEGNSTKYGWGNNFYKNTDVLALLIEGVGLYTINYKTLVRVLERYKFNQDYNKHYFERKKEIVISVPCEKLFKDMKINYYPIETLKSLD